MNSSRALLAVQELTVTFAGSKTPVLSDVALQLETGKVLAVVGESGSGKTMLARSVIGLLPPGAAATGGRIAFMNRDLAKLPRNEMRALRGEQVSMVFQEPQVSLNPVVRIGRQMTEAALERRTMSGDAARQRALGLLERVRISDPEDVMRRFPHELSGGMCQRIMIATALMLEPALLIADEPTTALDCAVQRNVLEVMLEAAQHDRTAVLLISHDLGLVAGYADDILVLRDGRVVEHRPAPAMLAAPDATYTRNLLEAATVQPPEAKRTAGELLACEVCGVSIDYAVRRDWPWQARTYKRAVDDVSLAVRGGETVALVGESGSGKTTLGRAILGLVDVSCGTIKVDGETVTDSHQRTRRFAQLVFQNPYAALSPRKTVWQSVAEPLQVDESVDAETITTRTRSILDDVGLPAEFNTRRPHELSGGQRQRVSIARALITRPGLVIADEPVSALDVTIQAQILKLFRDLQQKHGFACLFITHDLGVVEEVADRVVVLQQGRIVESGKTADVFENPQHAYTRELLTSMPVLQHDPDSGFRISNRQFNEASP